MGFSDELRQRAALTWDKEKAHPFVMGIGDGTLPLDNFRYYMRQDYVFLIEFCRAISLAVAKARTLEDMGWFCADFDITEEELLATKPSPTTWAYTRHMINTAHQGTVGETAAVILPCSWGYAEIGQALYAQGTPEDQPLYTRWIETYNSQEFADIADWLRGFVDKHAETAGSSEMEAMERAFRISSQYEYMFWDAAWRMEEWPV